MNIKRSENSVQSNAVNIRPNDTTGQSNIVNIKPNDSTGTRNVVNIKTNDNSGKSNVLNIKPNDTTGQSNVVNIKANDTPGQSNVNIKPYNSTGTSCIVNIKVNDTTGQSSVVNIKPNDNTGQSNVNTKPNDTTGQSYVVNIKPNDSTGTSSVEHIKTNDTSGQGNVVNIKPNGSSCQSNAVIIQPSNNTGQINVANIKPNDSSGKGNVVNIKPIHKTSQSNIVNIKPNDSSGKSKVVNIKHNNSTGTSCVVNTKTNDNSCQSSSMNNKPNDSSCKSKIVNIKPKDNHGKGNVVNIKPNGSTGKSNVVNIKRSDNSGQSNIVNIKPNDSNGKSNVVNIKPNDSSGKSKVVNIKHNNSTGTSCVVNTKTNGNSCQSSSVNIKPNDSSCKSKIVNIKPKDNHGKGNVVNIKPNVSTGKGNVVNIKRSDNSGQSNIVNIKPNDSNGKSNVVNIKPKDSTGTSSVVNIKPKDSTGTSSAVNIKSKDSTGTNSAVNIKHKNSAGKSNVENIKPNDSRDRGSVVNIKLNDNTGQSNVNTKHNDITDQHNVVNIKPFDSTGQSNVNTNPNDINDKSNAVNMKPNDSTGQSNVVNIKPTDSSGQSSVFNIKPNHSNGKSNVVNLKPDDNTGQSNVVNIKPNDNARTSYDSTENVPKPQKLILEILNGTTITNFENFLQQRIGQSVQFKIDKTVVKSQHTDLVVEFPSETASRKAADILHMSNEKEKQQVWCYYYKRKRKRKSRNLSNPHKSDDGKYQSETQMEQNSQIDEYETLMQKETKPNLNETTIQTKSRYKPHEMNTDATCKSQITSVVVKSDRTEKLTGAKCMQQEATLDIRSTDISINSKHVEKKGDEKHKLQDTRHDTKSKSDGTKDDTKSKPKDSSTNIVNKQTDDRFKLHDSNNDLSLKRKTDTRTTPDKVITEKRHEQLEKQPVVKHKEKETNTDFESKQHGTKSSVKYDTLDKKTEIRFTPNPLERKRFDTEKDEPKQLKDKTITSGINEKKSHATASAQFSLQGNGEKSKHFAFKCETSNSTSVVSNTQSPDPDIAALTQKKYHHCKDDGTDSETKDEIDELEALLIPNLEDLAFAVVLKSYRKKTDIKMLSSHTKTKDHEVKADDIGVSCEARLGVMVASTDSKQHQAELTSDTTTDPLTMQCAENIQSKAKDEITENCAVQHAGNTKAAEQITHDKLEESKILTENLVTADDSKALGLHLKGNDEVTLITRNKGQTINVLTSNEGTKQHETDMNCTNENKDGVFGGRITISKESYETTSQTTELTVVHRKNEPRNDIKDKTMHETSKITKIKLDDAVNISNMNSCSTDNKMECDDTTILTEQDDIATTDTIISNVSCDCNQQASARTDTANNAESKFEQPATKSSAKVKPQILEIEIVDLHDKRDLNFERFLLDRLQKPMTFKIKETETIQNVFFLSVEFPTTNSSKQAKLLLHKSNSSSKTKIWCSINKERKLNLRKERQSNFVSSLADVAKKLITKHNAQLKEILERIEAITDKKPKFQAIDVFRSKKKEKEALTSKQKEMENQDMEFKSFLSSMYDKLENLRHYDFDEEDLTQLETAFKMECERFSTGLPIYARRTDIVRLINENQASVILGETGSGKSTQVVQYLYQTGRFEEGSIVCTQPRKVAAISLATRVAKEMESNVGHLVGYQVGLHTKKCKETKILYMTDHVLLNECLKDPRLSSFSCIIIDEAHERSIFTDLLLGMIKKCLTLRTDLRVVITSATIDPDVFVRFFGVNCPVLSVSGRTFPVVIEWSGDGCDDNYEERSLQKAIEVHRSENKGDILVFLTSPLEVDKCCQKFETRLRGQNDFECLPLHGKLQANEQQRVFNPPRRGKRKIVFATNSAETSITIPGIKYVIDSGRIKEMQFDPKKNISSLVVTLVTKSSANQRSGRAGRTAPGKCFRLYSEKEYNEMNACSTPEILRVNLCQALLKLIELGVDPVSFDFVESPPKEQLVQAMETLESIGAITDGMITELGKWVAKLPFHPIFGKFVHDALELNIGIEALVLTACCGSGGSLFYRSGSAQDKLNADKMRIRFSHQGGDVMTMLNAYREWHRQPENTKGKWCAKNCVNGKTIKAVRDTVTDVLLIFRKELKIKLEFKFNDPETVDLMLQKMLFKTFKHNICHFLGHEKAGYHVIHKAHNVCLFPSSALPSLGLQPNWIVIEQVLQINRDYGINATPVPVEWIEEGIREGWLKEFGMERAEQQKVKQIILYGVGDQSFRDFVGPRYTQLKELEMTLQNLIRDSIVIVDTDSRIGEISVYGSETMVTLVKQHIDHVLVPIQTKYKDEKSEQYLSSTKQGTRVVMSAGCSVADVLMPDEYKSVMVVSFPGMTQFLTVDIVREEFEWYGDITHIEMFRYNKNKQRNWGKVTFETTNQAENAVAESQEEEIIALPTGNARLQNEHRLRAKLEWCRRPSKGSAFVEFSDIRLVSNILRNHRCLVVGGTNARLARSKKDDNQIYVNGLSKFVNEEVLRHSFVNNFGLNDDHIVRASVVRERVQTSGSEIETIRRRLSAHLERYVTDGRFNLQLKPPKDKDFTFVAFASFSIIEEGRNACLNLVENFRPNGEIINSSVSLQASLLVIRTVFEQINSDILKSIARLNKNEGINIRHRILRNGNCAIDMNCDHIDTLHRVRRKLDKLIQGKKMTKQDFPNIHELFTRSGKYELRNIGSRTSTLIIDDYRILEISIFGDRRNQNEAFTLLQEYLHKLTQGVTRTLALKGPDKPYGVIKKMFILYDIDLGKMKRNIRGLHCLQIDLRNHTVSINGLAESVDESILEINNVIDDLRNTQNCDHVENEEHQCSICFMEIDDGEIYRLEACGHPFCKTCIVPQLESAVGNNDFPITCCKEDCGELWSWRDLNSVSLQSGMSINSLVNRATNSYVAKHDKEYKYCISPDCPSIYRVTLRSDVFCCCECEARICTACHSQYHDGLSCDMVKELKEDPSGIQIWLKKDPNNRKPCPNCSLPIEKAGGCNHIECTKCRHHICWVCLEHFKICRNCYIHLEEVHGGYGGDY